MTDHLLVEEKDGVAVLTMNRPDRLNALSGEMLEALVENCQRLAVDRSIGCVVITGSAKAFAAGADIKEMQPKSYMDAYMEDFITANWERVTRCRKPVIAAVNGYALGGGCELAMMCDFILAGDGAKFGQPEINLGVIPGSGGTQRLTRFVGKSKAMEMVLTARMMDAEEAERSGLVSRIVPSDDLVEEAVKVATRIAELSRPSVMMVKEAVNKSYESMMREGVMFERRLFHSLFATEDQSEGMAAFAEKRKPNFKHK